MSTVYAGKGLKDALTLVDDAYPLYIWQQQLRGALDTYYGFIMSAQECFSGTPCPWPL